MARPAGPPLEELVFDFGDVTLHALAAGPADGPLVILLHGFPEIAYGWRRQIVALASFGYRVVAPDQRGYNLSSKPRGASSYTLDLLAGDVIGVADGLGRDTFSLAGHDWGGIVAWWTALSYPDRVRRLVVLNAPHPAAMRRYVRRHWSQLLRSWYIAFFQLPRLPDYLLGRRRGRLLKGVLTRSAAPGTFGRKTMRLYREAWSKPGAMTAMINWYRALRKFHPRDVDLDVHQPTLILWGDYDRFLEFGLAKASRRYCDNARIVRLDGVSHWVQSEAAPRVSEEMLKFLRRR